MFNDIWSNYIQYNFEASLMASITLTSTSSDTRMVAKIVDWCAHMHRIFIIIKKQRRRISSFWSPVISAFCYSAILPFRHSILRWVDAPQTSNPARRADKLFVRSFASLPGPPSVSGALIWNAARWLSVFS